MNFSIYANFLFLDPLVLLRYSHCYITEDKARIQKKTKKTVATSQAEKIEPLEGKSTEAHSSPPRVIYSHC